MDKDRCTEYHAKEFIKRLYKGEKTLISGYKNANTSCLWRCEKHGIEYKYKFCAATIRKSCGCIKCRRKYGVEKRGVFLKATFTTITDYSADDLGIDSFQKGIIWFEIKAEEKFGDRFKYVKYWQGDRSNLFVLIECPTHGLFEMRGSAHIRSKTGCFKCGIEENAKRNAKGLDGVKICPKCGIEKPTNQFRKAKTRTHKISFGACLECEKERDARYRANMSEEQRKRYKEHFAKHNKDLSEKRPKYSPVWFNTCPRCGVVEVSQYKPKTKRCKKCTEYLKNRERYVPKYPIGSMRPCIECGKVFEVDSRGKGFCSDDCRTIAMDRKNKEYKRFIGKGAEVRAKRLGVKVMYNIKNIKVFERDKWRCNACGCKVQKKNLYADNAAEVDHIVPLSLGGPHTYNNVQTLCRKCNIMKSNKYKGQLVMQL